MFDIIQSREIRKAAQLDVQRIELRTVVRRVVPVICNMATALAAVPFLQTAQALDDLATTLEVAEMWENA
jgi:hypothetical protein